MHNNSTLSRLLLGRPLLTSLALIASASLFFWLFPTVDHAATGLFYSTDAWFPARTDETWKAFRRLGIDLPLAIIICLGALVLIRIAFWKFPAVLSGRQLAFLLTSAALGPGLLVNILLKDFWGRPRPHMVVEYGGDLPYARVWEITDRCADNCSFVSGEASASFWLLALVFLLPKGMRTGPTTFILMLTASLSLNRIAFGGHFISDIVISWGLTLFIILAMKALILDHRSGAPDPYDNVLTSIGRSMSRLFAR